MTDDAVAAIVDRLVRDRPRNLPPLPDPRGSSGERTRAAIPKTVKQAVWVRDSGRCRKCGITDAEAMSRDGEHLHYDHITPWSQNGADTADNLQLLCGRCNREKGDRADPLAGWTGRR